MSDSVIKFTALSGRIITIDPHVCPALNQLEHYITIQKAAIKNANYVLGDCQIQTQKPGGTLKPMTKWVFVELNKPEFSITAPSKGRTCACTEPSIDWKGRNEK
jgi:hypothetical protein